MGTNRTVTEALTTLSLASVAAAGIVGSARADEPGLMTLFVLVLVLSLAALTVRPHDRSVAVRADIAVWLERTSAVTGESPETIAARGLSAYRAQLARPDDG